MRKKILILDCDTDKGEFINRNLGTIISGIIFESDVAKDRISVVSYPVYENKFPSDEEFHGAIITGSHFIFNSGEEEKREWMINLKKYVLELQSKNVPILGICYGMDILTDVNDGFIDYINKWDSESREFRVGYNKVNLTDVSDELFSDMPKEFRGFVFYSIYTRDLPSNCEVLASNNFGPMAYKIGRSYAVQFHPEIYLEAGKRMIKRKIAKTNGKYQEQFVKALEGIEEDYKESYNNVGVKVIWNFIEKVVLA